MRAGFEILVILGKPGASRIQAPRWVAQLESVEASHSMQDEQRNEGNRAAELRRELRGINWTDSCTEKNRANKRNAPPFKGP